MVSQPQNYPPGTTMPPSGTVSDDRGIREPSAVPVTYAGPIPAGAIAGFPNFWGSVIGGTLVAMTFMVLSIALMFGCSVGVVGGTGPHLTWGSAIWTVITAWLAYLLGGFVSSSIGRAAGYGWLRGLTVWGLSLPLAVIIFAIAAASVNTATVAAGAAPAVRSSLFDFSVIAVASAATWTIFCSLALGCLLAILGGMLGNKREAAPAAR